MTAGATVQDAPAERWHRRAARRLEKPWERTAAAIGLLSAIVGLAGGLWALWDQVFPPAPAEAARAAVEHTSLTNVQLRAFRATHPQFAGDRRFTPAQLGTPGAVLTLDLALTGLAHTDTVVRWTLIDPDHGRQLSLPRWAPSAIVVRPASENVRLTPAVWVPYPSGPSGNVGWFVVRFTVAARGHTLLANPVAAQRIQYFDP